MELKTTQVNVLEIAEWGDDVKTALKKLFPEAFEDKYFDLSKLIDGNIFDNEKTKAAGLHSGFMLIRGGGEYKNKAFYVDDSYDWELKRDSEDFLCLIPTKKSKLC